MIVGIGLKRIQCYLCNLGTHIISEEEVRKSFKYIKRIVIDICTKCCENTVKSPREC